MFLKATLDGKIQIVKILSKTIRKLRVSTSLTCSASKVSINKGVELT